MADDDAQSDRAIYAHSVGGLSPTEWEPLSVHLRAVGDAAAIMAETFGWGPVARVCGLLHDIGKCSAEFQAYIASSGAKPAERLDHSTAGAREVLALRPPPIGRLLGVSQP